MCSVLFSVFFFKRKTAYDMRISDWSSDVCSSDLSLYELALQLGANGAKVPDHAFEELQSLVEEVARTFQLDPARLKRAAPEPVDERVADRFQIGRASCRERVCQ